MDSAWYYLDANGVMIHDTTMDIDGVSYTFDSKWGYGGTDKIKKYDLGRRLFLNHITFLFESKPCLFIIPDGNDLE